MVSVQAYLCSETIPLTWVGEASLEYVHDDAQVRKAKKKCACGKNYMLIQFFLVHVLFSSYIIDKNSTDIFVLEWETLQYKGNSENNVL